MEAILCLAGENDVAAPRPRPRVSHFLQDNAWKPFLALGIVTFVAYFLLFQTENQHNTLETIINLVCAAAIFVGIRRNKPAHKAAWYFILAGYTIFGIANIPITYWVWKYGGTQPFPSIADAGYLLTEPLICIGLVLFIRGRKDVKRKEGNLIDAAILAVGVGFPIYALLVAPNLIDAGVPLLTRLVSAAYPVADLMLIAAALAFVVGPGRRSLAYRLLAASFVSLLASDLAFTSSILGGYYTAGSLITAGWPLFSILGATAALHPSMTQINTPDVGRPRGLTRIRILLLAATMISLPVVDFVTNSSLHTHPIILIAVTTILFGLLAARLMSFQRDQKVYELRLAHQAFHDPLTGLANSALFRDRISHLLRRRERSVRNFALYFLDLDDFKAINDELGHAAGDELLRGVGERLVGVMRAEDTVARLGGDEFAVLAERWNGSDNWHEVLARRILETTRLPYEVNGRLIMVRASLGVVLHDDLIQDVQIDDLLRDADVAMYSAKAHGKSRFALFEEGMHNGSQDRSALENEIMLGIARGEFVPFYQPIVSLSDGRLRASEALVRWNHPERGLLPPSEFIDIAEASGLIVPLGRQVLAYACEQLARWKASSAELHGLRMHVNVSVRQLNDPELKADLERLIAQYAIDPSDLVLEITETSLVHDIDVATELLKGLKEVGVLIAIDDFGTGYSSLVHLRRFPIDILKIDKSFVDGITRGPEDAAIVEAVVTLARELNMDTVAEGVETIEQLNELRRMRCLFAQGYLLGRPKPGDAGAEGIAMSEPDLLISLS
ncbi:MAG: hypothetical protein QOH26_2069 [Actinomycetota bacterium]|nr:hypothetical protein [Actinomycetota bacterium]